MRYIIFLFAITLSFAKNTDLIKINSSNSGDTILLKGKSENCVIYFPYFLDVSIDLKETTCINMKNSKKINIFCTKNKEICKTVTEISYFRVTGKNFPQKKSTKIPFVGEGAFNFVGGSGTLQCVEINRKGEISFGFAPSPAMLTLGEYDDKCQITEDEKKQWNDKTNPYWIDKNAVCEMENGITGLCTALDIIYNKKRK